MVVAAAAVFMAHSLQLVLWGAVLITAAQSLCSTSLAVGRVHRLHHRCRSGDELVPLEITSV